MILAHPQLWSKSLPPIWRVDLRLGEVTKWSPHSLSLMLKSPKASAGEIRVFSLFCPPSPSSRARTPWQSTRSFSQCWSTIQIHSDIVIVTSCNLFRKIEQLTISLSFIYYHLLSMYVIIYLLVHLFSRIRFESFLGGAISEIDLCLPHMAEMKRIKESRAWANLIWFYQRIGYISNHLVVGIYWYSLYNMTRQLYCT